MLIIMMQAAWSGARSMKTWGLILIAQEASCTVPVT
jgi:hypothetical protein